MIVELVTQLRDESAAIGTGKPAVLMAQAADTIEALAHALAEVQRLRDDDPPK